MRYFLSCVRYAWRGSFSRANTWATLGGAAILFVASYLTGWTVSIPNGIAGLFVGAIYSLIAVWVVIFVARLAYAPIHFRLAPKGGLIKALQAAWGMQMWPLILMASGVLAFVILFGTGVIWFVIQRSQPAIVGALPAAPIVQSAAKPTRFYSQRNKDEIADALTDLTNILDRQGNDVVQKTQHVLAIWGMQQTAVQQQKMPDTDAIMVSFRDLELSTSSFYRAIFDSDGFLKKYPAYRDELQSVLQFPENSPNSNAISILQIRMNAFRDGIAPIALAKKYNDPKLIAGMMASLKPALDGFLNGDDIFRAWMVATKRRIANEQKQLAALR